MTISSTTNRVSQAGNDVTVDIPFPYWFPADTDLVVLLVNDTTGVSVPQTLTTNYTIAGADNPSGGTVTMLVAPASGETTVVYRDVARTQELDLVENDEFPVGEVEKSFDRGVTHVQRVYELITRALRLPDSESSGVDMEIPNEVDRASSFLAFDATGKPIAAAGTSANLTPVSAYIDTLLDDSDAATARRTLEALGGFQLVAAAGTDTYTSTNSPVHASLIVDAIYAIDIVNPNATTTPTLAVDSVAAKTVKNKDGTALSVGQLNGRHLIQYDGTDLLLLNPAKPKATICTIYNSGTQSIPNDLLTTVTFDNEESDDSALFDSGVDDTKINIPTGAKFRVHAHTTFAYNATGYRLIDLLITGTVHLNGNVYKRVIPIASFETELDIDTGVLTAGSGWYVQMRVHQNSGGALDAGHASSTLLRSQLSVEVL